MAPKDRNIIVTSDVRDLLWFWCLYVLCVGFHFYINMALFLAWSSSVWVCIVPSCFVNSVYDLDSNGLFHDFQTLTPWLDGAWALYWNMMLINALIISSLELQFPLAVWCHPPFTLSDTHTHFTDVSKEGSRCWEEMFAKATVDCVA